MMKVLNAELVSTNKRARVSGGVYVEFNSLENVVKNDYFRVVVDGSSYDFQVTDIKPDGEYLKVTAKEVGYWASKLDHKGVDLRTVIGCEVIPVRGKAEISEIYKRSCWC